MPSISYTDLSFGELVEQIKTEGRLKGSADLNNFVKDLINELLLDFCSNNLYFELLKLNVPIATLQATGQYPLPSDYHQMSLVRYTNQSNSTYTLYPRNQHLANPLGTLPRYYQLAGNIINIMPFDGVVLNEFVVLDYHSLPTKLTEDEDIFPIPKLIPALKRKAIYRALLYNATPTSPAYKTDANESEARSAPH